MIKKYRIFIIILLLTGCHRNINTNFFIDDLLPEKGKALVMMRSYSQTPHDDEAQIMQTIWKKDGEDAVFKTAFRKLGLRKDHQDMQIHSLEPGKYTLKTINTVGGGAFGMALLGGKRFSADNLQGMVNFIVESGDVIYVGDIFVDTRNTYNCARAIKIEDYFDIAKENINNLYPKLEPRLQKKMMKLSKGVTIIQNLDKNTIDGAIEGMK